VAVAALAVLSAVAGCSPGDSRRSMDAGDNVGVASTPFEAVAADQTCPATAPAEARCYRVEVPADWSKPHSSTISLPVVVVPATGPDVRPDPLVVPAGGPGGSMTPVAARWSDPHRDIVLYDQRGTGAAEPLLDCPERNEVWVENLQIDGSFEEERAAIVDALNDCRHRLEMAGIDLDDYDTEANVADLDAIRMALGYDQWNILGISYGARLTMAAMRSTPNGIRSVILDSVDDVTTGGLAATRVSGDRAFAELAAACNESTTCATQHDDLSAEIDAVERRYNAAPVHVQIDLGDGQGPQEFVITGADMMGGLFQAMYDPVLLALLPSIIGDLSAGDTAIVGELVRRSVSARHEIAWGMNLTVNCADHASSDPDEDASAISDPGRFRLLLTVPLCSEWPVEPTSDVFNEPVESDISTLVMAGRFDPITPPSGSEAVAGRLSNATFALWPNRGHVVTGDPCADTIMSAFLENPAALLDLTCVEALTGPRFL